VLYLLSHPMERPVARALADALGARGVTVDWEGLLRPGDSWEEWDGAALDGSAVVVALLPSGYEARDSFAYRVDKALERADAEGGPPLVAVLLDGLAAPAALAKHPCVSWGEAAETAARILAAAPVGGA